MSNPSLRRLPNNTLSALIGAAAFAILTTGTAVAVATTAVSITDPSSGTKTHVTGKQTLATSDRDPYTGTYAKTDAAGKRLVGDGTGALTVDGLVGSYQGVPATGWTADVIDNWHGGATSTVQTTVPASGKLTIRVVSAKLFLPAGQHARAFLRYTERGTSTEVWVPVPLVPQGAVTAGTDTNLASLALELHPVPGSTIYLTANRSDSAGTGEIEMVLVGHLS